MNFTYYFSCACDFEKTVHQIAPKELFQCASCYSIDAKEITTDYYLTCVACGHDKPIKGNAVFDPFYQETCQNCGLMGEIGFDKGEQVLFVLGGNTIATTSCHQCNKNEWVNLIEDHFTCPECRKPLQQELSLKWDE